jgi:hypothetical protein
MRAIIVAGPMKTGTSALSLALSRLQRSGKLPSGAIYPVDALWPFKVNSIEIVKHHSLRFLVSHRSSGDDATAAKLLKVLAALVSKEGRLSDRFESDNRTAIFVWEGLAHRVARNKSVLTDFHSLFGQFFTSVHYVVGVRRQDQAIRSLYAHGVRGNSNKVFPLSFGDYVKSIDSFTPYDYNHLFEIFREQGLSESFVPLVFEENNIGTSAHLQRFLSAAGLGPVEPINSGLDGRIVNPSLPETSLNRIAMVRNLEGTLAPWTGLPRILDEFWVALRQRALKSIDRKARTSPEVARRMRFAISPEQEREVLDRFIESNKSFSQNFPELAENTWLTEVALQG